MPRRSIARDRRALVGDPLQAAGDLQVFPDGEFRVRGRHLDHVADPPPGAAPVRADRLPERDTRPALGRIMPSIARMVVVLPRH